MEDRKKALFLHSGWHSEELHCRLWQDANLQQNSPWVKPVLQCAHTTGSLHRAVRWVTYMSNNLFCQVYCELSVVYVSTEVSAVSFVSSLVPSH